MHTLKNNESGSGVVEVILIIIIIALIAVVGWLVYKNHKKTTPTPTVSSKQTTTIPTTPAATSSSANEASGGYLTISEWGVKFPVSGAIANAYYYFNGKSANLSVQSLSNTDCAANKTSVGLVGRFMQNDTDAMTGKTLLSQYPSAVKIGNYYYYYNGSQAECSQDSTTQATASADSSAFAPAVAKIQAQ